MTANAHEAAYPGAVPAAAAGAAKAAGTATQAPDRCPRCGGGFACGMAGAAPCACTTVKLDEAVLATLRQRHAGCLCLSCLVALAAGAPMDGAPAVAG